MGGRKVKCEKNCTPQEQVQHKEKHFTLLGFTALSEGEELSIKTDIDPIAITTGDVTNEEFLTRISAQVNYIPVDSLVYGKTKRLYVW